MFLLLMKIYGGLWNQIAQESPDYLILLGDNVYNDVRNNFGQWQPASVEAIQNSYAELEADEGWSALSSKLGRDRIFATWDDHDYGLDNGDRTYVNRDGSLEAFLNFFHTDAADFDYRLKRGGVYKSHIVSIPRGDELNDFIVKVIMMDTRYFKDPKGSAGADILGDEQWTWLEAEINGAGAGAGAGDDMQPDLILLGSSIQVLSTQKIFEETWSDYPVPRQRLLNLITNSHCQNILILSGDVHMMEVSQVSF
jgi:alkaline phosphatase D